MILKLAGISNYKNVTLEDVSAMMFSQNVIRALQEQCAPSVWCLAHNVEIAVDKREYLQFCDLDCMLDMPDECLNQVRVFVAVPKISIIMSNTSDF